MIQQWTQDQDNKLQILVELYGVNNWSLVAQKLNRTPHDCENRFNQVILPLRNHRPWTYRENQLLKQLQGLYPNDWTVIQWQFPDRSCLEVRQQYNENLRPREHLNMTLATEATERFTFAPSRTDSVHKDQVQEPSILQTLLSPFTGVMTSCTGTPEIQCNLEESKDPQSGLLKQIYHQNK